MAISETSLRDVVLMAADEITTKGGVLGRNRPLVVRPVSTGRCFSEKASS